METIDAIKRDIFEINQELEKQEEALQEWVLDNFNTLDWEYDEDSMGGRVISTTIEGTTLTISKLFMDLSSSVRLFLKNEDGTLASCDVSGNLEDRVVEYMQYCRSLDIRANKKNKLRNLKKATKRLQR